MLQSLRIWSKKGGRKPLLLRGARQVGKTWLVRELGKSFETFVEFNLEAQPELQKHFLSSFGKPESLVKLLEAESGKSIRPFSTLLFIDEVQECPEAIIALRYFKEKMPDLHVIAAGSLVEFALRELSFPVGRIETMHVFPLSFAEYLSARGKSELRMSLAAEFDQSVREHLHGMLLDELRLFMLVGGMPEVVARFVDSRDIEDAQATQQQLVTNFRMDFSKYASHAKIPHVRKVFDGVPRQLGRKFVYSHVAADVRSRELAAALSLLEEAGVVSRAFHSSGNGVPLSAESAIKLFKVYFVDIGLCNRLLGLRLSQELALRPELIVNRGGMAEQFVAQELLALTPPDAIPALHYWHREERAAQAEVDFLFELDHQVLPIEVKSGTSSKTKSLRIFMREKESGIGVCLSSSPLAMNESIRRIPLYQVDQMADILRQGLIASKDS
ncbi:MAG: ATP-binding protein [Pseudomonadota bacterium]